MLRLSSLPLVLALLATLFASPTASAAGDPPPLRVTVDDGHVVWTSMVTLQHVAIEITGPDGLVVRRSFDGAETPSLDLAALGLPDGDYAYQAVFAEAGEAHGASVQNGQFTWTDGEVAVLDAAMTILHNQDVTIVGSACVGLDCNSGESFGFDTLRIKENNLRIHFDDTSASASFPSNDWRIQINDASNGGASYFAIDDATAETRAVRIDAGVGGDALVIRAPDGNVGLGTFNPALELQIADGDTPAVRLDQDGTDGWAPQAWDVAGNETNFFVRDVTAGETLPFRIRTGAPTDALHIAADGNVGLGTATPDARLTVEGDAGITGALGAASVAASADYAAADTPLRVTDGNTLPDNSDDVVLLSLDGAGNLTTSGTVNGSSSVHLKTDFLPVDNAGVLAGVRALPLTTWRYRADADGVRHLGPMSQDFRAAFGLGSNDTSISMADADGVALASIQALAAENDALRDRIATLERLVSDLAARDQ